MKGVYIKIWHERLKSPNDYRKHNRLVYVATIQQNSLSYDIPINEEVWDRKDRVANR